MTDKKMWYMIKSIKPGSAGSPRLPRREQRAATGQAVIEQGRQKAKQRRHAHEIRYKSFLVGVFYFPEITEGGAEHGKSRGLQSGSRSI